MEDLLGGIDGNGKFPEDADNVAFALYPAEGEQLCVVENGESIACRDRPTDR